MQWRSIVDRWIGAEPLDDPLSPDPETGLVGAVVVTGGSDGIGFEIAAEFVDRGHRVVLVARTEDALHRAVHRLRDRSSKAAVSMIAADITEEGAGARVVSSLREDGLVCDVLVNCAGIGSSGLFHKAAPADLDALLAVNVAALTRLTRDMLPGMRARKRGGVLNVASFGGLPPGPFQAAYYASKAYVISLSDALAWENRGTGVRIACVAPGPVETRFHARMAAETALYRRLLPAMTPRRVARSAVRGFVSGRTLIVPGLLFNVVGLGLRLTPRKVQAALTGMLLKPRGPLPNAS